MGFDDTSEKYSSEKNGMATLKDCLAEAVHISLFLYRKILKNISEDHQKPPYLDVKLLSFMYYQKRYMNKCEKGETFC